MIRKLIISFVFGAILSGVCVNSWHSKRELAKELEYQERIAKAHEVNLSLEDKYKKEREDYEKTISKLRSDIASNRMQFVVKAKSVTTSESGETRCELDPETSQRLISITEDGDRNTRELNQCIETYNKVRDLYK